MTSAELNVAFKKHPVGVACGLLCLVFGGLIYFRSGKIAENQAEYEAKSAQADRILSNVRNSGNLPEQVAEIQSLAKEMESRLMKASQLAVNLQYFYKLEAENEVKLTDIRQGTPAKTKAQYIGVPYSVSVQGSYKQILAFLQRLENGRHFCRFYNVNFSKVSGFGAGSGQGSAAMTLSLTIELLGQP